MGSHFFLNDAKRKSFPPFLNTDQKVLEFLASQPTTFAVVKKGDMKDLRRITQDKPFHLEEIKELGGKFLLKIEKI